MTLYTAQDPKRPELGSMPIWNLTDFYPSRDSAEFNTDLATAAEAAKAFKAQYEGKLDALMGAEVGAAIAAYEVMDERLAKLMVYGFLTHALAVEDAEIGQFYQGLEEKITDISADLLFFTYELRAMDEAVFAPKLADAALAHYAPWLRDLRAGRPHQLSKELEQYVHDKSVVGSSAWIKLFDETMASLRFDVQGETLTSAEAFHMLSDADRAKREAAAHAIAKVLGQNTRLFARITNTLAKSKEIEDKWRKFAAPQSAMNLANLVEDEVVEALRVAVQQNYGRLSHRYYALKAKWFGQEKLEYWDRNAPLPKVPERSYSFAEAKDIVLKSYHAFSPELAAYGAQFFENGWIDAPVKAGKMDGAFAHPSVPSVHPYLMLNFMGTPRDVATMAHELGHGVHQLLAGKAQGHLMSSTPLTLAETASVFGEMLTFRAILAAETDPARRKALLAGKVEDMLNTVVRQIAFYDFELRVHHERRQGELTPERIGEIWLAVQRESLGDAIHFADGYEHYWSYISHFIHSPFYVYAYAFGDCLVNALYDTYLKQPDGFVEKYLELLKAGGTLRHADLLAPFGLDATDPAFWSRGLNVIAALIDELEGMA